MTLVKDIDILLSTEPQFLLGKWISAAKAAAADRRSSSALAEYNARNQITLWGPWGNILDYAAKQWSGLVSFYYLPRWRLFFRLLER